MFDTMTTDQLYQYHRDLTDEHGRRYDKCMALPVLHPDYPVARDAMYEIGDTVHAVYAEIKRREAEETADA